MSSRAYGHPTDLSPGHDGRRLREATQAFRDRERELEDRIAVLERENRLLRLAQEPGRTGKTVPMAPSCYRQSGNGYPQTAIDFSIVTKRRRPKAAERAQARA